MCNITKDTEIEKLKHDMIMFKIVQSDRSSMWHPEERSYLKGYTDEYTIPRGDNKKYYTGTTITSPIPYTPGLMCYINEEEAQSGRVNCAHATFIIKVSVSRGTQFMRGQDGDGHTVYSVEQLKVIS